MVSIEEGLLAAAALKVAHKHGALFIEKMANFLEGGLRPKQIRRVARAEADASVTKAEADIKIAALQDRAAVRVMTEELRTQRNIEAPIMKALPNIREDAKPEEMDDDWLANFFDKCRLVSNEEMQNLWGQILAGEANKPGAFTHRTVNFLATLTQKEAFAFRKICSLSWQDGGGGKHPILFEVDLNEMPIDTNYQELQHLNDIGLIVFEPSGVGFGITEKKVILNYHGERIEVDTHADTTAGILPSAWRTVRVGRLSFTQIGRELSSICESEKNDCVAEYVTKQWMKDGLSVSCLLPVPKPPEFSDPSYGRSQAIDTTGMLA